MKKNYLRKILVVSVLSLSTLLASCNNVDAKPGNIDSPIVGIEDGNNYFKNTIETIYNDLINSGTTNTTVFDELITNIAKKEVVGTFASEEKINEICQEILLNEVKGGSYSVNNLFNEEKYVSSLKSTNPGISFSNGSEGEQYNNDYLIMPEDTFENVFKANYTEYIEKKIKPGVLKSLLVSKYLYDHSSSSLSRSNARDVQYIKLTNFANKPGEVNNLINEWLGAYINNPTETIDLDELQAIYKGIEVDTEGLEGEELARANRINDYISRYYTLRDEIDEDLAKIVETNEDGELLKDENGFYILKNSDDTDQAIEDEYTGTGLYTVEWGEELAKRNLLQQDFTGEDIYTKSKGISDLPTESTDRLFSASISSYIVSSSKGDQKGVDFLTPKTILNGSNLGKYYSYDSASNSYYIVVVNKYFTSSVVNDIIKTNETEENKYDEDLIDIAYDLSESSTNQRSALVYYLQQYDVGNNIHDETFYQYIVDNYSEIIK